MKFTPDAFGEGRDRRMTIVEILTLMAFFVSLLTLIVTLVHVTFDITFRMLESRNKKDDKKEKMTAQRSPTHGHFFFNVSVRS